jgi:hypothetical protein
MLPSKSARRAARTLCAAFVLMGGSAVACSGDDGVTTGGDPDKKDAGNGVGGVGGAPAGGNAGSGGGSLGASGNSGNGGAFGASGAYGNGGASSGGSGGSGGVSGSGPDASAGGTGGFNTCNPGFCPNTGAGMPCCVTGNGPCGVDIGQGCMAVGPGRDR